MKNIPSKIHLVLDQISEDEYREADFRDCAEVCWCEDKVGQYDIPFIRSQWIDVNDKLPKDGQQVLVINKAMLPAAFVSTYIDDGEGLVINVKVEDGTTVLKIPATHWLPVPETSNLR